MRLSRLLAVLAAGALAVSAFASGPRTLSFEDRVKAQEAIERVFFEHRIWPKENLQPKPPFEQMVPRAVIEAKVTDDLKKSAALEKCWQHPVKPEQLQAEMDRMAKQTKDPEGLRELFAALGNDPYLIAECLAKPALANRFVSDQAHGEIPPVDSLAAENGDIDLHPTTLVLPQIAGESHANGSNEPCLGAWKAISQLGAPASRWLHTATWTGSEMIVWGGSGTPAPHVYLNTGGRYVPATDTWTATSTGPGCPPARLDHTAVWTGSRVVIWGGDSAGALNTGGQYDPVTDGWTATSVGAACPTGRSGHTAIWTGTRMVVWGGHEDFADTNTGGQYNPAADSWTATSASGCPLARSRHSAVWTGSRMAVWGGYNGSYPNTGGLYDPVLDAWTPTSTGTDCPDGRQDPSAVWTGSRVIVWGGLANFGSSYLNTGGEYNPVGNTWSPTSTGLDCPAGRTGQTAIWSGAEMVVWGGADASSAINTGGRYQSSSGIWHPTLAGVEAPAPRIWHSAVWTGAAMIVWGGYDDSVTVMGTGSAYTWKCCGTVVLSPPSLSGASLGVSYSESITASGGTAPYTYAITSGSLPGGLTLSSAGLISGVPTQSGTFPFTVTATDSYSCTGSQAYSLVVSAAPCPTIALSPATLPAGTTGTAYSQTITASGGTAPYTFAVTIGSLPGGLSLGATGILAGTPVSAGSFSFAVTATDANKCTGSQIYSITVSQGCPSITLSPTVLPDGTVGTAYNQSITAGGGTAPYTYAITSGSLPAGLALGSGGMLSGTPSNAGASSFTVTVTDANHCPGSQAYSLRVAAAPPVVFSLQKVSNPFRIVVGGLNLQFGIQVSINGAPWSNASWKNTSKLVIKGGASLKAAVPRGVDTVFTFVNPDGGQASVTWHW